MRNAFAKARLDGSARAGQTAPDTTLVSGFPLRTVLLDLRDHPEFVAPPSMPEDVQGFGAAFSMPMPQQFAWPQGNFVWRFRDDMPPQTMTIREIIAERRRSTDSRVVLRRGVSLDAPPLKILIVEKDGVVMAGLRAIFAAYCDVAILAEAGSLQEVTALGNLNQADIALLSMHSDAVPPIANALLARNPFIRIVARSPSLSRFELSRLARAGVRHIVPTAATSEELGKAIDLVLSTESSGSPPPDAALPGPSDDIKLSNREIEVLRRVASGFSNKEIARDLAISVRTVETHRLNLRRKTGASYARDLRKYARQIGLGAIEADQ